ncbi:MAG TPA: hypothetical protein VFV38_49995 [Ktedonobacteraceae bacterium]|nr:hypothetical protein [Ktedonobacteraceae bacterium]
MAHLFPIDNAVSQAFACMYWEDVSNPAYYETFMRHWGGLDLEHMRRAL